jgi:hypothetical protein
MMSVRNRASQAAYPAGALAHTCWLWGPAVAVDWLANADPLAIPANAKAPAETAAARITTRRTEHLHENCGPGYPAAIRTLPSASPHVRGMMTDWLRISDRAFNV